jgi:hypothetical protein
MVLFTPQKFLTMDNTQLPDEVLPKEWLDEIKSKAQYHTKYGQPKPKIITECKYQSYILGATAYATKAFQAQQEIESLTNQLKKQNEVQVENMKVMRAESEKASALLHEVLVMNEMWGDLPGEYINKIKQYLDGK